MDWRLNYCKFLFGALVYEFILIVEILWINSLFDYPAIIVIPFIAVIIS